MHCFVNLLELKRLKSFLFSLITSHPTDHFLLHRFECERTFCLEYLCFVHVIHTGSQTDLGLGSIWMLPIAVAPRSHVLKWQQQRIPFYWYKKKMEKFQLNNWKWRSAVCIRVVCMRWYRSCRHRLLCVCLRRFFLSIVHFAGNMCVFFLSSFMNRWKKERQCREKAA